MKAAILTKQNAPLVVDDVRHIPFALDYGQVLVKILSTTICGAQVNEITGAKGEDRFLPHLLGHEGCGEVVLCGLGVTRVQIGDRVVLHWRKGVGIEALPPRYAWGEYTVGAGPVATFGETAIVSENRLTPIGKDIPPSVASLMGCAITTGLGLINNEAHLKIGQSIAVAGVGGVGMNVIQGAAMVSANPIVAIDRITTKFGIARLLGATHTIDTSCQNMKVELCKLFGKVGVDVFVDCTGVPSIIDEGLSCVASGGKMILVAQPAIGFPVTFTNFRQNYCGKTILDSQGGMTNPNIDIPRYLALYREDKLQLDNLISHSFPISRINEAVELVKSGIALRVALEING